jgi:cardiolipin synthase (CMP-forming)
VPFSEPWLKYEIIMKKIPLTVPNLLSLFRLCSFPFVLVFIFAGWYKLFVFFMWLNLTTDILDGFLARRLNLVSDTGAKLDGLADTTTYILGLTGIFVYKWADFEPYAVPFFVFLGLFVFSRLFSLLRFRRFYGYQTYAGKTAGYIHGSFFLVLFIFGFYNWFCILMLLSGFYVFTENIIITILLKEPRSYVKGLYWVLKTKNSTR